MTDWKKLSECTLDWFLSPNFSVGWIDDQGQFWGVNEGNHKALIDSAFSMHWDTVIEKNWIVVGDAITRYSRSPYYGALWRPINDEKPIAEVQRQALIRFGFTPDDAKIERRPVDFHAVYPNGYEDHKIPKEVGELLESYLDIETDEPHP